MKHWSISPALALVLAWIAGAAPSEVTLDSRVFRSPWMGFDTGIYPQGIDPWASAVADFDGDGVPDLATVSFGGTAYLSILFGDGQARFSPATRIPLALESLDLVAADFDGDGDIDIVTANTGRLWEGLSIALYKNDGSGTFGAPTYFATGDDGPSGLAAADFNGDGLLDIAAAHDGYIVRDNSFSILLNNGAGGFSSPRVYTIGSGTNDLDSGDLDGDGDADLVVAHEPNFFTVLFNEAGSFVIAAVVDGIPSGSLPQDPTVHLRDVDLDGDLDVLFSNRDSGGGDDGAIGLWRNLGDGNLGPAETIRFHEYTPGGVDIEVQDVTGDGWPDLLVANVEQWFLVPGDGAGGWLPARGFRAGEFPVAIEASDLDDDLDLDVIVVASGSLEACVYRNTGKGNFVQPDVIDMTSPSISPAFTTNLKAGDVDGDGDLDLVIGYRSDFENAFGISVRRNLGNARFSAIETYPATTYPIAIDLADMDGDLDLDVLYIESTGRFHIRKNDGAGRFSTRISRQTFSGEVEQIEAVDVDGDGDRDVVVNSFFSIGFSMNLGGDAYSAPRYNDLDNWADRFGFGDFNHDGKLDLLTNSGIQGYAELSLGNGDGTFGSPITWPTGRDIQAFASGDVNNDGKLDFTAIYNLDEKGLSFRRGLGNGTFAANMNYHGSYWQGDHTSTLELVDVDGDGDLDALTVNFGAQDLSLWRGHGNGAFDPLVRYGIGQQAIDLEFGDFDGDGVGDVAAVCQVDHGGWWYPGVVILHGLLDKDQGQLSRKRHR